MFDALLDHPGVTEELALGSRFGFMAYHGGSLEEGTDDIAREAASRSGASYYGVLQPPDLRWHVPSTAVDPAHSGSLRAFLDHVEVVVTVHGFGRDGMFTSILLGGRNRPLAATLGATLRPLLTGYEVIDDLGRIPFELRGQHAQNPVNRPVDHGVQVELPPRVRGAGPFWDGWDGTGRTPHTEALIEGMAATAAGHRTRSEGPQ